MPKYLLLPLMLPDLPRMSLCSSVTSHVASLFGNERVYGSASGIANCFSKAVR